MRAKNGHQIFCPVEKGEDPSCITDTYHNYVDIILFKLHMLGNGVKRKLA